MNPYTLTDAEAELRAAINDGDETAMRALEPVIDRLDQATREVTVLAAALWYAEHGMPVFPLLPGRKSPLGACPECKPEDDTPRCPGPEACGHDHCHGLKDATLDAERITRWWTEGPKRNIGIATGHRFDAVDVDGPLGQKSRAERWDDIFGQIDADSIAKVLTPRPGGMHIYVPPTGDGSGGGIVPGVDYRGTGGYVVAPPSVILPGGKDYPGTYRFLGTPRLELTRNGAAA